MVGYYAGEDEAHPTAAWVLARREPGAQGFGPLSIVADAPGKPEGNGVLFRNADGQLLLIYGTMHGRLSGPPGEGVRWTSCDLKIKRSADDGVTWSEDEMIAPDLGHVPRCKPIRLRNGDIIFGTEYKDGYSRFWISSDEGRSWTMTERVSGGQTEQPALIERSNGSLLALLRPAGEEPRIFRSESKDGGWTWSPAVPTEFSCPHAALDAVRLAPSARSGHRRRAVSLSRHHPDRRWPAARLLHQQPPDHRPYRPHSGLDHRRRRFTPSLERHRSPPAVALGCRADQIEMYLFQHAASLP
jgi:hypothetical protein